MAKRVQIIGHATAAADAFVGRIRELTVDTSRKEVRVHDGATPGGLRIPNKTANDALYHALDILKINATSAVITINSAQDTDIDFLIKANGVASAFFVDGANGAISIGFTLNIVGTLSVDVISEISSAVGVTIDSVLLKDGLVDGRDVATDGTKLDGVESSADVTDATNVASAGAAMNADNLSGLANAGTARTNLGLVIGTNVLPELAVVSQVAAEAGIDTAEKIWTAERVKQAFVAKQATQAAIEAETDEDTYIPPDLIKHSPGVAKVWGKADVNGNLTAGHNVTSVTDDGTGLITFTWATDFSSANYSLVCSAQHAGSIRDVILSSQLAGSISLRCHASNDVLSDPGKWHVAGFGDQS